VDQQQPLQLLLATERALLIFCIGVGLLGGAILLIGGPILASLLDKPPPTTKNILAVAVGGPVGIFVIFTAVNVLLYVVRIVRGRR
jgi:hypothetical protein